MVQLWPGDIFNCFFLFFFLVKKRATFKWKDAISGFPVFPGSAEALGRWGGKIKYGLFAYFLCNICAKNCRNWTVYVKIIASQRWDVFLRCPTLLQRLEVNHPFIFQETVKWMQVFLGWAIIISGLVLRDDEHMALRLHSADESSAPSQWLWCG